MLSGVVGINWGDEGKGRMVDLLSARYEVVVRYQGGNNAGHTVVNERGRFILNLLPSGILRDGTMNVLGPGMVIDVEHLVKEIASLRKQGITITPMNLLISDRATICMPYHRLLDNLEEDRLADKKYGSTRRGIAPVYGDKYMKKTLRMGDLFDPNQMKERLKDIVEWKNLIVEGGYRHEAISADEMWAWIDEYGMQLRDFVRDSSEYLEHAAEEGKNILFEAQLGALRDIDYGIYPYTSSSSTLAAYATLGAGVPNRRLDRVIGITKAYSSCVGEGPFVCEFFGDEGKELREAGKEYGAATGRPRRVGGFDVIASRYGVRMQGATELALTKLDVLSGLRKIPVCVGYELNGERIDRFGPEHELEMCKPVYEYLPGFSEDISKCRKFEELPKNAQDYVSYIEKAMNCPIRFISVGAEREDYIERN